MASIVIKLIDKNNPELVEQAKGELIGAGYSIEYEDEADFLGVDVKQNDNGDDGNDDGEQVYGPTVVLIGKK
jgi:hypothetical protein